ncbi:MAG: aminotransferase class IV [Rhodospirillales bacterium]
MTIWLNGHLVDAAGAVDATDRGVLLGDGLFETIAFVDGVPLRFSRHISRLEQGATVLGMPVPAGSDDLLEAISALAINTGITEGSVRITLLRGSGPRGVLPPPVPTPTLVVQLIPGTVGLSIPLKVIVAKSTCRNERSPLSGIKSTNYLDAILARREAADGGADDALMVNTQGRIAEASAANVFCRFGDALVTPPLIDGALPGIMRQCVIDAEGAIEQSLPPAELHQADEIFLTSSLGVRAVVQVDDTVIGGAVPGKVATRLADLPRRER